MATYLEMLIKKYETALSSQRELQKVTPRDQAAQHQLLDQNVAIFREMLDDLRALSIECSKCKGTGGAPLKAGDDCGVCDGDGLLWNETLLNQVSKDAKK